MRALRPRARKRYHVADRDGLDRARLAAEPAAVPEVVREDLEEALPTGPGEGLPGREAEHAIGPPAGGAARRGLRRLEGEPVEARAGRASGSRAPPRWPGTASGRRAPPGIMPANADRSSRRTARTRERLATTRIRSLSCSRRKAEHLVVLRVEELDRTAAEGAVPLPQRDEPLHPPEQRVRVAAAAPRR